MALSCAKVCTPNTQHILFIELVRNAALANLSLVLHLQYYKYLLITTSDNILPRFAQENKKASSMGITYNLGFTPFQIKYKLLYVCFCYS